LDGGVERRKWKGGTSDSHQGSRSKDAHSTVHEKDLGTFEDSKNRKLRPERTIEPLNERCGATEAHREKVQSKKMSGT